MKKILVLCESASLSAEVSQYLRLSGFGTEVISDSDDVYKAFMHSHFDMIICGVLLGVHAGFSFIMDLRKQYPDLRLIFITSLMQESYRILGFEVGCDDYITTPLRPVELILRVRAVFRRSSSRHEGTSRKGSVRFEKNGSRMTVDFRPHRISVDGKSAELTAAEWRIFYVLVSNDGRLISRASLLHQCFDYDSDAYDRLLDTHIKNIRRKLGSTDWIETVRGAGYIFAANKE